MTPIKSLALMSTVTVSLRMWVTSSRRIAIRMGFPDVALNASKNSQELIIFNFYPNAATSDKPINLAFQLPSDFRNWETVSISQLK